MPICKKWVYAETTIFPLPSYGIWNWNLETANDSGSQTWQAVQPPTKVGTVTAWLMGMIDIGLLQNIKLG